MAKTPAAILYNADGTVAVPVKDDDAITIATQPILGIAGLTDEDKVRWFRLQDDGSLIVAITPPVPPAGANEFVMAVTEAELRVGASGDVSSPHTTIGAVIGNALLLHLQLFTVGTEGDPAEAGSKVEIYWREGGGPTDHLVERIYIDGETITVAVPSITKARDGTLMTGNGTDTRLVVVRTRTSTPAKEIDFVVRGYTK